MCVEYLFSLEFYFYIFLNIKTEIFFLIYFSLLPDLPVFKSSYKEKKEKKRFNNLNKI
jgi:hypothetical protein